MFSYVSAVCASVRVLISFFFSSRRRHTRCGRDWSSDVCSSDLSTPGVMSATVDLLATDEMLRKYDITPGVELKCLGYPLGDESNSAGFPILRSGDIASYPLLPTGQTKTFLFDFRVFKGNSGGPVYFSQPQFRGSVAFGGRAQFIMGMVVNEHLLTEPYGQYQLSIGVVVHASLIKQTIDLLPAPETPESSSIAVELSPIQ